MVRILWKRICETYAKRCAIAVWFAALPIINFSHEGRTPASIVSLVVIVSALLAALGLGYISPEPPEAIFIAPFSRDDRRKWVVKVVYGKIAVGMVFMIIASVFAALLGTISMTGAFTACIMTLSTMYMGSFNSFYNARHQAMVILEMVMLWIDLMILLGNYDGFDFLGKDNDVILLIAAVILLPIHYFVNRRYFKPMVECYSDYEEMTDVRKKEKSNVW